MESLATVSSSQGIEARLSLSIRRATLDDISFMDALQKAHGKALGYFPTGQFKGYVEKEGILIAEAGNDASGFRTGERLGYIIYTDRYLKNDQLGAIFQVAVVEPARRHLVAAKLVEAVFDHAAYGTKLFCCWCAQDLPANLFWESLGFVPLAFRAGSMKGGKKLMVDSGELIEKAGGQAGSASINHQPSTINSSARVHIFWQKRIDRADESPAKWWFPYQTSGGAIGAARLVFPIPPGVGWRDVDASVVPEHARVETHEATEPVKRARRAKAKKVAVEPTTEKVKIFVNGKFKWVEVPKKSAAGAGAATASAVVVSKDAAQTTALARVEESQSTTTALAKPEREKTPANDPRVVRVNRELRDRYLELFNADESHATQRTEHTARHDVRRVTRSSPTQRLTTQTTRTILPDQLIEQAA